MSPRISRGIQSAGFTIALIVATVSLAAEPSAGQSDKMTTFIDATPEEVIHHFRKKGKVVLTFCGFSGARYENKDELRKHLDKILEKHDPKKTIVNCGATAVGIGAAYEIAKKREFETTGIVSSLAKPFAKESPETISPAVDTVFFVEDKLWGGIVKETGRLSPTSRAMVQCSDEIVAIGGGAVARDELLAAKKAGKKYTFVPADMNHKRAIEKARKKDLPTPTDFRGAAHKVFGK